MSTRNPAHLDNFHTKAKDYFRIVSPYVNPKGEPSIMVYASGRTEEEAKEHFYMRFMLRGKHEQDMMMSDQKKGGFIMQRMLDGRLSFVEGPMMLLAEVQHV